MSPEECNVDSILSLMGATIFHFIVGIKIMWGNVTPYITSYLVQFNPDVTTHQTLHVYTMIFLGQSLFMYLGGQLEKKIGPRPTAYLGATLIAGGTYLSSYCKTLNGLIFLQGLVGVGIGLSYSAPIICAFKHFNKNKGLVTGIITTGTGAGPFLAGLVATTYVNSENYPVDPDTGLYDPTTSPVTGRVPEMFRLLGIMYAVIGFVGASLLISPYDDEELAGESLLDMRNGEQTSLTSGSGVNVYDTAMLEDGQSDIPTSALAKAKGGRGHQRYGSRVKFNATFELTTPQMIRDSLCWLVIATAICTGVSGFYVAATYKNYGAPHLQDDHFITVVGCFGCLCSGLSRMLWGSMADRIGTFETLEMTAYISPIVMLIYTLTVGSKMAFGICVCTLFALWGASYCLVPAIAAFLFGDKHMGTNYGFIFLIFGVTCTIVIDSAGFIGWEFGILNYVFIAISLVGAGLCSHLRFLTSKVKDEKLLRHHRATSSMGSMF